MPRQCRWNRQARYHRSHPTQGAARAAIEKPSYSGAAGRQSVLEKFQYLITRRNRRLTRLVDQVSGHHTMRGRDVSLEKWR
jgi:hypothetical protein